MACVALLGGCASISVRNTKRIDPVGARYMPARIYVENFYIPRQNLRVDRKDEKLMQFQAQFSESLARKLVKNLDKNVASTKRLSEEIPRVPSNSWLIIGRFDKVNQGSRALRSTLGFGLGGTKVDATAVVYDLSRPIPRPLLWIETTGGSNSAPGALTGAISPTPLAPLALGMLATNVGMGALPGLDADAKRTAREITAAISEYCYQQGLIPKGKAMKPKKLGQLQIRFMDPARPKEQEGTGTVTVVPVGN